MVLRPLTLLPVLLATLLAFTGCDPLLGGPDDAPDAGPDAGDGAPDGGDEEEEEENPHAEAGLEWDFGAPIDAPLETWTYVHVPESRCGNGTETGFAVNLSDRSDEVLIFLAAGGACWDSLTCLMLPAAAHINDTVQESITLREARSRRALFSREDDGPFKDASFVYIPYCTGDVYSGRQVTSYRLQDELRDIHHLGALNIQRFLERIAPTFPDAERVWLSGASAGGFGATINWWVFQDAFAQAQVNVLNDGAAPVDFSAASYGRMLQSWNPLMPPGCLSCREHLGALLPYYAQRYGPPHRYALLTSTQDSVISGFGNVTAEDFSASVYALREGTGPGQKTFFIPGVAHVLLFQTPIPVAPSGVSALEWIRQFRSDDPDWDHQGD